MKIITYLMASLLVILLSGTAGSAGPAVLFDQGHGQHFLVEKGGQLDLSSFAGLLAEAGLVIRTTRDELNRKNLETADIVVISGAFSPVSVSESEALLNYLREGGRLALMTHIHQPYFHLFERLGVAVTNYPICEQENIVGKNPTDFLVTDLSDHEITRNLTSFTVYGSWGVRKQFGDIEDIARTSDRAWIDMDRDGVLGPGDGVQSFPIILAGKLGRGRFAVFGDDAIFQNGFLLGNNLQLARNLIQWLNSQDVSI